MPTLSWLGEAAAEAKALRIWASGEEAEHLGARDNGIDAVTVDNACRCGHELTPA